MDHYTHSQASKYNAKGKGYCISSLGLVIEYLTIRKTLSNATTFDFSALREGYLDRRSVFKEISEMQDVFAKMLSKFAEAIQSNKNLVKSAGQTSSGQHHRLASVAAPDRKPQMKSSGTTMDRRMSMSTPTSPLLNAGNVNSV